jgi:glycerol-3-phosphate dehydrogenase
MNTDTVKKYEFAIIGAGVVGTAIARELTKYTSSVVVIDSQDDVGAGTSKANTAILHTGFDMKPNTLESKLVSEGYRLLLAYAKETDICVEKTGAILVAWNQDELIELENIQKKAVENGYLNSRILSANEIQKLEPDLGPGILGGLEIPDEFIIDPWSVSVAFATQAKRVGADFKFNSKVLSISQTIEGFSIETKNENIQSAFLINAAGLYSDVIDRHLGFTDLEIHPRRGELIVFDKLARTLVNHIILPVPTKMGKGVLVSPTIFGNIMLGPTAVDVKDKEDTSTTEEGVNYLLQKGKSLAPKLLKEEITTMYTGLRAASNQPDYFIKRRDGLRFITVGGIRSTGLTASMAIAEYVLTLVKQNEPEFKKLRDHSAHKMPILGEASIRPYQDASAILKNPLYGEIVCHCEHVSKGEILDALRSEIPATSLSGLSRRTRACLGRCQGFYCYAKIEEIFEQNSKQDVSLENTQK